MIKLNKKLLAIGLNVLFFSVCLIFLVRAQVDTQTIGESFRVNSASTTPENAKRAGDRALINVINRSGKDYMVPNSTPAEFESFRSNAPNYVSVSVCGDGVGGLKMNAGDTRLLFQI